MRAAEHRFVKLRAHQPVAVLAGMRALVFADHRKGLFGDRPHLFDLELLLDVQHRAHMQAADRGMGVPGAVGSVLLEDAGQTVGVIGEVFELHRAVFEKRDRLSVALHRHHDVEALRAHLPDRLLKGGVGRLDDAVGKTEIAHQLDQRLQAPDIVCRIVAGKFGQQDRGRLALHKPVDDRAEHRDVARQLDHRAVDQLDRAGPELDDLLGRRHRTVEAREMADAEHPVRRDRLQFELDLVEEREGALGADQKLRHVVAGLADAVDVVAADPPQHLRKPLLDLVGLAPVQAPASGGRARDSARASLYCRNCPGPRQTTLAVPSASRASMPRTLCTMLP